MLLLAVTGFVFMSCDKDDDEPGTYTCISFLDGTYDITLYEYNSSGDKIFDHTMYDCVYEGSCTYRSQPGATKVKVYAKKRSYSPYSPEGWIQRVYMLKPGEEIIIDVRSYYKFGSQEP